MPNPILRKGIATNSNPILRSQFAPVVSGNMTALSDDFDGALGSSTITGADSASPSVTINPAYTDFLMTYTRYSGCLNRTPNFTIDMTDFRQSIQAPNSPWEHVWRYVDDSDPGTILPREWNAFDTHSIAAEPIVTFSKDTPFTEDVIEVATKPRFRYIDIQRSFSYMASSSFYQKLPSCDSDNVFATDIADSSDPDNSLPITSLNQYALLLDDTSVSPDSGKDKINWMVVFTVHSSEDQGDHAAIQLVNLYLEGTGTTADDFRKNFRLYVLCLNPGGRYYGAKRFTDESGSNHDANRNWDDNPSPSGFVEAAKQLMLSDVPNMDLYTDWHGDYRLNGNGISAPFGAFFATDTVALSDAHDDFKVRMTAASAVSFADLGNTGTGFSATWAGTDFSSTIQLSMTPEWAIAIPNYPAHSAYVPLVTDYVEALLAMEENGELQLRNLDLKTIRVLINGSWTQAIPYVFRQGQWVRVEPYVLNSGAWIASAESV